MTFGDIYMPYFKEVINMYDRGPKHDIFHVEVYEPEYGTYLTKISINSILKICILKWNFRGHYSV